MRISRQFINVDRPQNADERVVTDLMKEHEFKYLSIHTIPASLFQCYIKILTTNKLMRERKTKVTWLGYEPANLTTLLTSSDQKVI